MEHHMSSRAPGIAENIVAAWTAHKEALGQHTLTYIDHLLTALVARGPIQPEELIHELRHIVPNMQYGTARRLVNLKFGRPERTATLLPASKH